MSFILEALKKSENQRQRHVGPSLADVQVSAPREDKPWWAFAVGGLLLANLAVLLFVLLRDNDTQETPTATSATATQQPVQAPVQQAAPVVPAHAPQSTVVQPRVDSRAVTSPAVRSLADEAAIDGYAADGYPLDSPNLAAAARVPEGPPIVRPIEGQTIGPGFPRPQAAPPAAVEPAEVLPTVRDLAASGTNLPEMHLDIHVHSANPAERFVFVNMRKYVEGQTLAEGPAVERITSDGVILNHRGMRFLLPRQ